MRGDTMEDNKEEKDDSSEMDELQLSQDEEEDVTDSEDEDEELSRSEDTYKGSSHFSKQMLRK